MTTSSTGHGHRLSHKAIANTETSNSHSSWSTGQGGCIYEGKPKRIEFFSLWGKMVTSVTMLEFMKHSWNYFRSTGVSTFSYLPISNIVYIFTQNVIGEILNYQGLFNLSKYASRNALIPSKVTDFLESSLNYSDCPETCAKKVSDILDFL